MIDKCGDMVCNADETCSTCYSDCRHECSMYYYLLISFITGNNYFTVVNHCGPDQKCSGHGTCENGFCKCIDDYTGPLCSGIQSLLFDKLIIYNYFVDKNVDFVPEPNKSTPTITITPPTKIKFQIAIKKFYGIFSHYIEIH